MTLEWQIILGLAVLVVVLFLLWRRAAQRASDHLFAKQSLSVKYGKMSEQFLPFLKDYPYDPQLFRFLGTPVDGVQFKDDGITFIEFKAAGGQLSPGQKKIKELVDKKRIDFREIRIE
jgi:predicted Holliday junction resolvase-like endonuclease